MKNYIRLLEAAAALEDRAVADTIVTKFVAHLKSIGRIKMLPEILRELQRVETQRHTLRPIVEVAHENESEFARSAAAHEGIIAQKVTVNPSLIRGWRAQSGGTLIDRSAKNVLLHMYQKITI